MPHSEDYTDNAVAGAAIDCASCTVCHAVKGRTVDLPFLNKRTHIASRDRIFGERFQLCLRLQLLWRSQKLGFGDTLAIDAGVQLAFFGRVVFREMRSPSIDPGLDLFRSQACCVDDRAISQVGTIDAVWVRESKAGAAIESSQLGKVDKRVGGCDAFLNERSGLFSIAR